MLTFDHVTPFGSLGALVSSPAIKTLQGFLLEKGQLKAERVTGEMNDATMAAIYQLLRDNIDVISKIKALPDTARKGVEAVQSILKAADGAIRTLTLQQVGLKMLLQNFSAAIDIARGFSAEKAAQLTAKRDEVYNAVGKEAAGIEKGLRLAMAVQAFVAPATGTTTPTGSGSSSIWSQIRMPQLPATFRTAAAVKTAAAAAPSATATAPSATATATAALPFVGCVFRYNKTRKKYVIYCRPSGGLGVADMDDNCLYGACALGGTLGQVAVTPPPPEGMVETSAVDSRAEAGGATDGGEENVPLYKRPWFWASVAGAAAVGAGGVVLWRRKRAPTAGQFAEAYGRRSYGGLGRRAWNARRGRAYYDWY